MADRSPFQPAQPLTGSLLSAIATQTHEGPERLREVSRYGIGRVIDPKPWDLAVLAFFPESTATVVARVPNGAQYYVTSKARHYIALADGSIFYAGSAHQALKRLQRYAAEQLTPEG